MSTHGADKTGQAFSSSATPNLQDTLPGAESQPGGQVTRRHVAGARASRFTRTFHHLKRAVFAALATTLVAGGTAVVLPGAVAYADGYYNNWPGHARINYLYEGKVVASNLQRFSPTPLPSLKEEFNSAWTANEATVCGKIQAYLLATLGSFTEWVCNLPSSGDLQGVLVGPNELGLDFQLTGISISLDYLAGGIDWVTVNGTFNALLQVDLDVASSIDWSDSSQAPVSIASSQVSFSDANFWSHNVLLHIFAPSALSDAQDQVDTTVITGVAAMLGVTSDISTLNSDLDSAATSIADVYILPDYPFAAQGFSLTLGVDSRHVTLDFGRGGSPEPAPSSCSFYSDVSGFAPGTTDVTAICSPKQPHGVTSLVLQDERLGTWTHNPKDSQYEPGRGTRGQQNLLRLPTVHGSRTTGRTPVTPPSWTTTRPSRRAARQ